jgi:hypothetical protein
VASWGLPMSTSSRAGMGSPAEPGAPALGRNGYRQMLSVARRWWRALNAAPLVGLVRAGARFENGQLAERPDESGREAAAARHDPG